MITRKSQSGRKGFTLMELLVAISILGFSMVAINGLLSLGMRNAVDAQILTTSQFLAETKLSEVKTGLISPTSTGKIPFTAEETMDPFTYEVQSQTIGSDGNLMAIQILVEYTPPDGSRPLITTLTTWMIDPQLELAEDANDPIQQMLLELEGTQ